jgi:hypothetical protein
MQDSVIKAPARACEVFYITQPIDILYKFKNDPFSRAESRVFGQEMIQKG